MLLDGVITLHWILLPSQRYIQIDNHLSDFIQYKTMYHATHSEIWNQLPGTNYNGKNDTLTKCSRSQFP